MKNQNRTRYDKTAQLMQQTLVRMVQRNGYDHVTISALCKCAGVNRSTFYAHYENLSDLVAETMDQIIQDFIKNTPSLHRSSADEEQRRLPPDSCPIRRESLLPYLEYVYHHQALYLMYIRNQSVFNSGHRYENQLHEQLFIPLFQSLGIRNPAVIRYFTGYYLAGITSILSSWVKQGCPESCEDIAVIIESCVKLQFR